MKVGRRQRIGPGVVAAVNPATTQSRVGSAGDVHLRMIAYMQYLVRGEAQTTTGFVEKSGIGLGCAVFARAELEAEKAGDADYGKIGIAIGERGQWQSAREAMQTLQCIGIKIHAIAFVEKNTVSGIGQRRVVTAFAQRTLDGEAAQ